MAQKARTVRRKQTQTAIDPRLILAGAAAIILLAVAAIYLTRDTSARSSRAAAVPLRIAPEFTLDGLNASVALADFRGQYVLLNFWASWCPPCLAEMPDLYAYYQTHRAARFTLLGVNVGEDAATVSAFLRANGFDFPVALDTAGAVYALYGGNGLPSSFLIGPDGALVKTWRPGAITRDMLERDVTPLLNG